ncbi:FAD-binding oxidoreductase [Mucilaginibacter sp. 22184]|uniref:FAD-binding oxidoreductase n=1 Tax=Mucilaginibacter sp. 22184 TaxID=3453887 RepID=UPI003F847773
MEQIVRILDIHNVTHNVKQFIVEKPDGFTFTPGQATELSINQPQWEGQRNPFTFTCLTDEHYLEFTIKIYSDHPGVTNHLGELQVGDELILREAWGAIEYKGPGYFIAGGAGITPFIAILRQLYKEGKLEDNILFFSNKTDDDIILADELKTMLGENARFTTTQQKDGKNDHRRIDGEFLKAEVKDFNKHFYVCGPDPMVAEITETLTKLGANADAIVFEK